MTHVDSTILLIDDDEELCKLLQQFLTAEGFSVDYQLDSEKAVACLTKSNPYCAVVLDIMMPKMSGFEVLQATRRSNDIPVIMLTGRGDDIDRIVGLEMGADDYLGKPCNPRELAARLRAVLRRTQNGKEPEKTQRSISLHGITLNPATFGVTVNGEKIALTHAEFRVLHLLMQHVGETLSKEAITREVLHRELTAYDRSIDVHISRVRQKISQRLGSKAVIKSVRGFGYQLLEEI